MKLTEAKYYSLPEIIRTFNDIESSGLFGDEVLHGQRYNLKSWLKRVFFEDDALRPRAQQFSTITKDYLHSNFKWYREVDDEDVFSSARRVFRGREVVHYWLSAVFGFFRHGDMIVQVNPAYLYALTFYDLKKEGQVQWDEVVREARIIPVTDETDIWAYNMFRYYFRSLNGLNPNPECEQLPDLRDHWLMNGFENLDYLKDRKMNLKDVRDSLYPLGSLIHFGVSYELNRKMENFHPELQRKPTLEDVRSRLARKNQVSDYKQFAFSSGGVVSIKEFPIRIEDSQRSSELNEFAKYLNSFTKRKDRYPLRELKEDLVRLGVYSQTTANRKSFINSNVVPDAQKLGFEVSTTNSRYTPKGESEATRGLCVSVRRLK
jgi:hypothetical protein